MWKIFGIDKIRIEIIKDLELFLLCELIFYFFVVNLWKMDFFFDWRF